MDPARQEVSLRLAPLKYCDGSATGEYLEFRSLVFMRLRAKHTLTFDSNQEKDQGC